MESWKKPKVRQLFGFAPALRLKTAHLPEKVELAGGDLRVWRAAPYKATHLEHAFHALTYDLVARSWLDQGQKINYLQSNADIDDSGLEQAKAAEQNWEDLARQETDLYRMDMRFLRVFPPSGCWPEEAALPLHTTQVKNWKEIGNTYQIILRGDDSSQDVYLSINMGTIKSASEKISKSGENFVSVSQIRQAGVSANAFRVACYSHHYASSWEWSENELAKAQERLACWEEAICQGNGASAYPVVEQVRQFLADDLDTPKAFAVLDQWASESCAGRGEDFQAGEIISNLLSARFGIEISALVSTYPQAILWDSDGTFVDSEKIWVRAEQDYLSRYGINWTVEQGKALTGFSILRGAELIIAETGLEINPQELGNQIVKRVAQIIREEGVELLPGVEKLALEARCRGIKNVLVTSSNQPVAQAVWDANRHLLDEMVCGEDVECHKPAPEPYYLAASVVGADIQRCLVVEDSPPGLAAGLASGARVVGVPLQLPIAYDGSFVRLKSVAQLDWEKIAQIMQGQVYDAYDSVELPN